MKTPAHFRFAATALLVAIVPTVVSGQGPLTPPGVPAPTMKTLDQVEARIIVNAANTPGDSANLFIIRASGSYYLTGNVTGTAGKNGISIQADAVTLDLNGFALIGNLGTRGIDVPLPQSGFSIRNGSVRAWLDGGVRADAAVTLAEKLMLTANAGSAGLVVGNGSMIKDCVASGNETGFRAFDRTQVSNCLSTENTGAGFVCTSYVSLIDCTSSRNTSAVLPNSSVGIVVLDHCSILHCNASRNAAGITSGDGNNVVDCTADSNDHNGIGVHDDCTVRGCTARLNVLRGISGNNGCHLAGNSLNQNGTGIQASSYCRIDGNSLVDNSITAVQSGSGNNFIVRNTVKAPAGAGTYSLSSSDTRGVIITVTGGVTIDNVSPWANFVY